VDSYIGSLTGGNEYTYHTFGNVLPNVTEGSWFSGSTAQPQASAISTLNQYAPNYYAFYEFMNGLNLWSNETLIMDNVDGCTIAIEIFNATPADLFVTIIPNANVQNNSGMIAAPGFDYSAGVGPGTLPEGGLDGSLGQADFELTPYGYLPIYSTNTGHYNMVVTITDQNGFAGNFNVYTSNSKGVCSYSPVLTPWTAQNGYAFTIPGSRPPYGNAPGNAPAASQVTIYNTVLKP
jgi:hypothetical protein